MNRPQAERATPSHVGLHIKRQRQLGERMIGDHDRPRKWDLLISLGALLVILLLGV